MVNNIISYELLAAAEAAENGVRRTWSSEQYREYAAKLDRLVEAASAVIIQRQEGPVIGWNYDAIGVAALNELTAALREIELPKTDTHGT